MQVHTCVTKQKLFYLPNTKFAALQSVYHPTPPSWTASASCELCGAAHEAVLNMLQVLAAADWKDIWSRKIIIVRACSLTQGDGWKHLDSIQQLEGQWLDPQLLHSVCQSIHNKSRRNHCDCPTRVERHFTITSPPDFWTKSELKLVKQLWMT